MSAPTAPLQGISSMAMRGVVSEFAARFGGTDMRPDSRSVTFESVGGVDVLRRLTVGEGFDVVVLGADAIEKLMVTGHALAGSRVDIARSEVAVAVRRGEPKPNIGSEEALRDAVRAARSIGHSTGPSGVALLKLFDRWNLRTELAPRTIEARPGVPVAALIASGEVALGFQQLSELLHENGIDIVGSIPDEVRIETIFSGAVCATSAQRAASRELLAFMANPDHVDVLSRHGMTPAAASRFDPHHS